MSRKATSRENIVRRDFAARFSRKAMGFKVYKDQPSSEAIQDALDEIIRENGSKPKHIISDRGTQFD